MQPLFLNLFSKKPANVMRILHNFSLHVILNQVKNAQLHKGGTAMDERLQDLRSKKNPKARIKILQGHFATSNSHINTYIDISTVKVRHNNCRETAKTLSEEYCYARSIDTIVCLEETSTIGTFMAEHLADTSVQSLSRGNNISIVIPEYHQNGQILFRDNVQRMILHKQVLVLAPSITSGKSVKTAIEAIEYYGGTVMGVCSVFSSVEQIEGFDVKTIFTPEDLPDYQAYAPHDCPMCKAKQKLDAIVNSYGYSKL